MIYFIFKFAQKDSTVNVVLFDAEAAWIKNRVIISMDPVFLDALQDGREITVMKVSFSFTVKRHYGFQSSFK